MAVTDLIDVVNEADEVIDTVSMQEARERGLIHRIARVMVQDASGELLLQKRTAKLLWPNCWDNSAAGHVDAGEDYLTAARRELFEEIGLRTDELEEVGTYFTDIMYQSYSLRRFNRVYRFITDETPQDLQSDEVAEVKWFSVSDAKKLVKEHPDKVTDGLKDVLDRYY